MVAIARAAAEIRKLKHPRDRGPQFHALARRWKMRHETLLKWGKLYQAFGERLGRLLVELGKTRLYVLAYAKDPKVALRDGVQHRLHRGEMVDVRNVSAEEFRRHLAQEFGRHISEQREEEEPRHRHWFRINRKEKKAHQARAVLGALDRTTDWLQQEIERVLHRIREGVSSKERKRIRKLRDHLRELATSITAELKAHPPKKNSNS